jgi:hypothetical protein
MNWSRLALVSIIESTGEMNGTVAAWNENKTDVILLISLSEKM